MDIRMLAPGVAVAPQIAPDEVAQLRAAGFAAIICNRPDDEVPAEIGAAAMATAAAQAGLGFVDNPVPAGTMSDAIVARQADAIAAADGPVLAYCTSGTRSAMVWLLGAARAGGDPEALLAAAREAGYALDMLRPTLQARGTPQD